MKTSKYEVAIEGWESGYTFNEVAEEIPGLTISNEVKNDGDITRIPISINKKELIVIFFDEKTKHYVYGEPTEKNIDTKVNTLADEVGDIFRSVFHRHGVSNHYEAEDRVKSIDTAKYKDLIGTENEEIQSTLDECNNGCKQSSKFSN